jgi:hypothetical protein
MSTEPLQEKMCNGLKLGSSFTSNGSKVIPLLYKSNLATTAVITMGRTEFSYFVILLYLSKIYKSWKYFILSFWSEYQHSMGTK